MGLQGSFKCSGWVNVSTFTGGAGMGDSRQMEHHRKKSDVQIYWF